MSQEEQSKKTSQVISDAAVKEIIPAKPTTALLDEELDKVAGGASLLGGVAVGGATIARGGTLIGATITAGGGSERRNQNINK